MLCGDLVVLLKSLVTTSLQILVYVANIGPYLS